MLPSSHDRLSSLIGRLLYTLEDERRAVARLLHDRTSQDLSALSLRVAILEQRLQDASTPIRADLQAVRQRLDEAAATVSQLSSQIYPAAIELHLTAACKRLVDRMIADRPGMQATWFADLRSSPGREQALCLYRALEETLRNIARHAGASSARVTLTEDESDIALKIEDDGVGFDVEAGRSDSGMGLPLVQERVRHLHGTFMVDSQSGSGTRVSLRIPKSPRAG